MATLDEAYDLCQRTSLEMLEDFDISLRECQAHEIYGDGRQCFYFKKAGLILVQGKDDGKDYQSSDSHFWFILADEEDGPIHVMAGDTGLIEGMFNLFNLSYNEKINRAIDNLTSTW